MRGRGMFRVRPVTTKNHYSVTLTAMTAGTTADTTLVTGVDAPTNRSSHVRAGSILRHVVAEILVQPHATEPTVIRCLMYKLGGATSITDGIAAYLDTTDPMIEDAIIVRRGLLTRMTQHALPPADEDGRWQRLTCSWKGAMRMMDGDDIVLSLQSVDQTPGAARALVWVAFTNAG